MSLVVAAMFLVAGVIHLLPVVGVLGGSQLDRLYGVELGSPELVLLMRHRALLFAGLGSLLVGAAFVPGWRIPALFSGLLGAAGFIVLARGESLDAPLRRVVRADWIAVAVLTIAGGGMALRG